MPVLLPYKPESAAVHPTIIKPFANGQLPANVMEPCGIRSFVLEREAARSMRALVKKARRDGIALSATGTYRSYAGQVSLFQQRYQLTPSYAGARTEWWQGKQWWLRKGVAGAAVPGSSNHGWGLAVDFSIRTRVGKEVPLNTAALKWLAENGAAFGWWNTTHSENWHWCWCLGDGPMPPAVLAEETHVPNPPAPTPPRVLRQGDTGEDVKTLQLKLNAKGFSLLVDGKFGALTAQAVRDFQLRANITVDGVVGPETWKALG